MDSYLGLHIPSTVYPHIPGRSTPFGAARIGVRVGTFTRLLLANMDCYPHFTAVPFGTAFLEANRIDVDGLSDEIRIVLA